MTSKFSPPPFGETLGVYSVRLRVLLSVSLPFSLSVTLVFLTCLGSAFRYLAKSWYRAAKWVFTDRMRLSSRLAYFFNYFLKNYYPLFKTCYPGFSRYYFNISSWNFVTASGFITPSPLALAWFGTFRAFNTFQLLNYFVWLRIADDRSVPEMRKWSILLIKSDLEWCILGPDSLKNFPGTCKRNFLCLQMILFKFLRSSSIGWTVSRGKHFVHKTRPGARDWPAACFPRPIYHTMTLLR